MNDYKLNEGGGVIRLSDGAIIPEAEGNIDWEIYQLWLDAGNTPDPALSLDQLKAKRKRQIKKQARKLIDAQIGSNIREQLMLLATGIALVDGQVRGLPRDPRQDDLIAVFFYVGAVRANKNAALEEIDDPATTDPDNVILVEPDIPN